MLGRNSIIPLGLALASTSLGCRMAGGGGGGRVGCFSGVLGSVADSGSSLSEELDMMQA